MKMPFSHASGSTLHASRVTVYRQRQDGIAVLSVLGLIAIVMVYVAANVRTLHSLDGELKLLESRQIHRLKIATKPAGSTSIANSTFTTQPARQ
jgi:hypothetical protein